MLAGQQQNGFGGGFSQNSGYSSGGSNGYPASNQQANRPSNQVPATIQQQYAANGGYQY